MKGKTILASIVIEEAQRLSQQAAVVYFYCKYQDERKKTLTGVLRELLLQSLPHDQDVLPLLYEARAASAEAKLESPAVLKDLLQKVLKSADKVVIVIDGLDECDEPQRKQILSYLLPLLDEANRDSPGSARALFTSQDVADMRGKLRKAELIALTAQDNEVDIRAYTEHWASKIQNRFDLPSDEVQRITKHVTETAKGKFT
jgi:Cdc6-like AAA superfamily ATPase